MVHVRDMVVSVGPNVLCAVHAMYSRRAVSNTRPRHMGIKRRKRKTPNGPCSNRAGLVDERMREREREGERRERERERERETEEKKPY